MKSSVKLPEDLELQWILNRHFDSFLGDLNHCVAPESTTRRQRFRRSDPFAQALLLAE